MPAAANVVMLDTVGTLPGVWYISKGDFPVTFSIASEMIGLKALYVQKFATRTVVTVIRGGREPDRGKLN